MLSYVRGKAFDVAIEKIKEYLNKKAVTKELENCREKYFAETFYDLPNKCAFDWDGLQNYIDANLFDTFTLRFLLPNREARERLHNDIHRSAYAAANANTIPKQLQVNPYLKKVLRIVENALLKKLDETDLLPSNMVVDELKPIIQEIDQKLSDISREIKEEFNRVLQSISYQNSFAQLIDNLKLPMPSTALFHYRNESIGFYGREQAIDLLDRFLDSEKEFCFTAVTGSAGSGKSKLLFEYAKRMYDNVIWKVVFLQETNDIKRIWECKHWDYPSNLLLIIDYAGQHSSELGKWIASLSNRALTNKLRIILLEREGMIRKRSETGKIDEKTVTGEKGIYPLWYDYLFSGVSSRDNVRAALYAFSDTAPFLELLPLEEEALISIMDAYAKSRNSTIDLGQYENIISRCKEIEQSEKNDGRLRPLILLFVTDSYLKNPVEYNRWNIEQLLDRLVIRYKDHWLKTICEGDKEQCDALQELLVYATATGRWDTQDELPEPFTSAINKTRETFQGKLLQACAAMNEKAAADGFLDPLEPDIVGEFFVLHFLQNADATRKTQMISAFNQKRGFFIFLSRCIDDYADTEYFSKFFTDGMQMLIPERFIKYNPIQYAALLVNLSYEQDATGAAQTVETLRRLSEGRFPNNADIAPLYAKGLVNLSSKQDAEGAAQTVETLRRLSEDRFPDYADIAPLYASGLVNLSSKQKAEGAAQTVETLRLLSEDRFPDNTDIAPLYARGLVSLSLKQDVEGAVQTVETLRRLSEDRFPDNADIAPLYARGLVSLSRKQDVEGTAQTIETLRLLSEDRFPDYADIAPLYAKGLVSLSLKQDVEGVAQTIETLRLLSEDRFPDNTDIAPLYASGLVSLSRKQDAEGAAQTVETLRLLLEDRFPDNADVALEYAWGLFNLSSKQDTEGAAQTIETLRLLFEGRFPDYADIALENTDGLATLSDKQILRVLLPAMFRSMRLQME